MRAAVEATGANRNTLKTHLRKLVESGHLTQHGSGRGTWYGLGRQEAATSGSSSRQAASPSA